MQPFVVKIQEGRSVPLGEETGTSRQHLESVTIVQGHKVVQVNGRGVEESTGPLPSKQLGTAVCLTFDTEDGRRFFVTYEYSLGKVQVTTSKTQPLAEWEDNPDLGITPLRLRNAE